MVMVASKPTCILSIVYTATFLLLCQSGFNEEVVSKNCAAFAKRQKLGQACLAAQREIQLKSSDRVKKNCKEMYDSDWGVDLL
jgi:hypothetical protein